VVCPAGFEPGWNFALLPLSYGQYLNNGKGAVPHSLITAPHHHAEQRNRMLAEPLEICPNATAFDGHEKEEHDQQHAEEEYDPQRVRHRVIADAYQDVIKKSHMESAQVVAIMPLSFGHLGASENGYR
jgi:hypothetical protein